MTLSVFGDLSASVLALLLASACLTSALTASLGAGGAVMLLAYGYKKLRP